MRAAGGGKSAVAVGGVVAVALEAFSEQKIAYAVARQIPRRAQSRRAAAQYQRVAAVFRLRGGLKSAVAHIVPRRQAGIAHAHRRARIEPAPARPRCGGAAGKKRGIAEKTAAGNRLKAVCRAFQAACFC